MATFQYEGKNTNGRHVRGVVAADTARAARDRLRIDGVTVRSMSLRTGGLSLGLLSGFQRRRYSSSLTEFLREVTTLLEAGIPLLDAIDACTPQTTQGLQATLVSLRDRVAGGESLAGAMEQDRWLFDDMIIGMVGAGEQAGNLEEALSQVADFRERMALVGDKLLTALAYPVIVLCTAVGVSLFLMTVVVPMLLKNLEELGRTLPWPTRVLKFLSDMLITHFWWQIPLSIAFLVAVTLWSRTRQGKLRIHRWTLSIPIMGTLVRKQAVSRISLILASLLRSGVELVEAMRIAQRATANPMMSEALAAIRKKVETGGSLKDAVWEQPIFPAAVAQLFAIGQQSGQLEPMLERLGRDYDRQAAATAVRLTSVAEPLLILVLSVIVGFILFATILPILEAGNVVAT